jgi:hypothetical protein
MIIDGLSTWYWYPLPIADCRNVSVTRRRYSSLFNFHLQHPSIDGEGRRYIRMKFSDIINSGVVQDVAKLNSCRFI